MRGRPDGASVTCRTTRQRVRRPARSQSPRVSNFCSDLDDRLQQYGVLAERTRLHYRAVLRLVFGRSGFEEDRSSLVVPLYSPQGTPAAYEHANGKLRGVPPDLDVPVGKTEPQKRCSLVVAIGTHEHSTVPRCPRSKRASRSIRSSARGHLGKCGWRGTGISSRGSVPTTAGPGCSAMMSRGFTQNLHPAPAARALQTRCPLRHSLQSEIADG